MKLKSFHWTRRTVVFALIGLAVLLALAVIWRSNDGVLSAHYNVTTTDGRIAYLPPTQKEGTISPPLKPPPSVTAVKSILIRKAAGNIVSS